MHAVWSAEARVPSMRIIQASPFSKIIMQSKNFSTKWQVKDWYGELHYKTAAETIYLRQNSTQNGTREGGKFANRVVGGGACAQHAHHPGFILLH